MNIPVISVTLLSAALLSSCSPVQTDIRPEVAQPLDEARILANGWSGKAAVIAKLNQAASVPNLNKDEQAKIRFTTIYALTRDPQGIPQEGFQSPDTRDVTQPTGPPVLNPVQVGPR